MPIGTYTPPTIALSELLLSPKANTIHTGIAGIANAAAAAIDAASSTGIAGDLLKTDGAGNASIPGTFGAAALTVGGGATAQNISVTMTPAGSAAAYTAVRNPSNANDEIQLSNGAGSYYLRYGSNARGTGLAGLWVQEGVQFNQGLTIAGGVTVSTGNVTVATGNLTAAAGFSVTGGGVILPRGALSLGALTSFAVAQGNLATPFVLTIGAGDFLSSVNVPTTYTGGSSVTLTAASGFNGAASQYIGVCITDAAALALTTAQSTAAGITPPALARLLYTMYLPAGTTAFDLTDAAHATAGHGYIAQDVRFAGGGGLAGLLPSKQVDGLAVFPKASANNVVTMTAGGVWYAQAAGAGLLYKAVAQQDITIGTDTAQSRYTIISLDPSQTPPTVTTTIAAPGAALSTIVAPDAFVPVAVINNPANTGAVVPASAIIDARWGRAISSIGSGGGSGGAPVGSPYVSIGNDPTLTDETDIYPLLGGTQSVYNPGTAGVVNGRDPANLILDTYKTREAVTDASLGEALQGMVAPNLVAAITTSGPILSLTSTPTNSTWVASYATNAARPVRRINRDTVTATATGATGTRYLLANLAFTPANGPNGFLNQYAISLATTPNVSNTSVLIGSVFWDSAAGTLAVTTMDNSVLANLSSLQLTLAYTLLTGTPSVANYATAGAPSQMTDVVTNSFKITAPTLIRIDARSRGQITLPASTYAQMWVRLVNNGGGAIDSDAYMLQSNATNGSAAVPRDELMHAWDVMTLQPGSWYATMMAQTTGAASWSTVLSRKILITLQKGVAL